MNRRSAARHLIARPRKAIRRTVGRARFMRSVRASDTFVVTFPKSGTTWVSYLLALVRADRATGDRCELSLNDSILWVPGVNDEYFRGGRLPDEPHLQDPRVFRVHAPYDAGLPRVVYIVRDPRDAMVSYYYHNRRGKAEFDTSIDEYVEGNATWPCDWGEHAGGWSAQADRENVLLMRYEDLKARTFESFRTILDFCRLELTDDELVDYIERSSFEKMQRAEEPVGVRSARDIRFIRKGVAGDWRSELSPESAQLIVRRYEGLMASLGYETATGEPAR